MGDEARRWRYQPIYIDDADGGTITLCEVYFDAEGKLENWSEPAMHPQGETVEELTADLHRMLVNANRRRPVPFSSLYVGMMLDD